MTVIRGGLFRENLSYEADVCDDMNEKFEKVAEKLATFDPSESGIIYSASIACATELYNQLKDRKGGVEIYHGKLSSQDRRDAQDRFMSGISKLMIATNAFGMGIDKADLRFVIHFNFPGSLEAYYQRPAAPAATAKSRLVTCCT